MIYRIQVRKHSSNIIEASDNNGKTWFPYLAPLIGKKEGDKLVDNLLKFLNHETN